MQMSPVIHQKCSFVLQESGGVEWDQERRLLLLCPSQSHQAWRALAGVTSHDEAPLLPQSGGGW